MKKIFLVLVLIMVSGSAQSFCDGSSLFVEKYFNFLDEMKEKKYLKVYSRQKLHRTGLVTFDKVISKMFTLKYDYDVINASGVFVFIFDLYNEKVYLSQYNEGAEIPKKHTIGLFRDNSCTLEFKASESQIVTVDFNDDLVINFLYKAKGKKVFTESSKFIISNTKK